MDYLNRSCRNILIAKYKLGLFSDPYRGLNDARQSEIMSDEHKSIALHIADRLNQPIAAIGAALHKIHLQESPNNAAVIYAEAALV